MSTKKATKRALLTSILAICLCLVMLIGSTFAWFTDTASTSVNSIQSGTLKVALEMKNATVKENDGWVNAEGKTLSWVQATGVDADGNPTTSLVDGKDILWEPGCTYELQPIRVRNDGNLALKYKIEITGIDGDAKLNKAITWTISDTDLGSDHSLAVGATSESLTIKGHMDENAGNEYQNLTINGIAITVYATQDTVEADSYSDQYDANATYPIEIIPDVTDVTMTKGAGENDPYIYEDDKVTVTVPATAAAAPVVTITKQATVDANVAIDTATQDAVTYDVKVTNVSDTAPATITLNIGSGLTGVMVYHEGTPMTEDTDGTLTVGEFKYDSDKGTVTFMTSSFSPFTIVADAPAAVVGGVRYYDLAAAIDAAENGNTIVLTNDIEAADVNGGVPFNIAKGKTLTVNLNGKVINYKATGAWYAYSYAFYNDEGATLKFTDTSAGQTGKIISNCAVIMNKGTLIVDSGTYEAAGYPFYTATKAAVTTLNAADGKDLVVKGSGVVQVLGGKTTIGAGIFEATKYYIVYADDYNNNGASAEIIGGTIKGNIAYKNDKTTEVVVTGGTFTVDPTSYVADADAYDVIKNEGTWTVKEK